MKVELIAELATNYGGDVELGKRFIRNFVAAGVDTIKIQVFNHQRLNPADPQYAWFKQCQMDRNGYVELRNECEKRGVKFLATGYHPDDVEMIYSLGCTRIKIGSGEANEGPMYRAVKQAGFAQVVVATGITGVDQSPFTALPYYNIPVRWLGCVSRYPAPSGLAYPMMMAAQGEWKKLHGWSDHSIGLDECKAAVIAGASILEFHVQLDRQARPPREFEKTYHQVEALRKFVEDKPERFVGRWQHGS
jgi:N,N'-diacetyllegionaminate synthase